MSDRRSEIVTRLSDIQDRLEELEKHPKLTRAQDREATTLFAEVAQLTEEKRDIDLDRIRSAGSRSNGGLQLESGTAYGNYPSASFTAGSGSLRDRARNTIDAAHRSREIPLPDYAAERAERLVTSGPVRDQDIAAKWAIAAGDPHYRTAFAKTLSDPARGHMLWTPEEQQAYQRVTEVRTAMSLGSGAGLEMVPLTLDPAIMLTNDGSINPLRRLARVVQTATNSWSGVTSAGATAEWKTEGAEAADGSPTLGQPVIPVHLGDVNVTFSYEVGMDAMDFLQELQRIMLDSADNLQAVAFTTGTGSGQPQGIVTGLAGTSSEINAATSETLTAADAFALQNALPARFSANASWQAHIAIINSLRQLETTNGALKFPEMANGQLLNKPLWENSNMDSAFNPAATANNYVLIYGDVRAGFTIVDRIGATLELLPGYGANRRPTAQKHAFLTFRTGSEVVVPQALRMLDIPTTA